MDLSVIRRRLSRMGLAVLMVAAVSACGDSATVTDLAAQTSFGADSPPLAAAEAPDFQQAFTRVAREVTPVVVSIRSARIVEVPNFNPWEYFFGNRRGENEQQRDRFEKRRVEGIGSGVLVSRDGYVLTNNHVVQGADDLTVTLSDDTEHSATVVGTDPPSDLAVIRLDDGSDLPVAHLGDSDKLEIGEVVIAIGSPYGLPETVTMGIVSARGRSTQGSINQYENFIQTDAAINPGNSGGPLVNLEGSVVGINTAIFSRSGGNQGIGFAIPMDMARRIMRELIEKGHVSRGYLGVSINNIGSDVADALNVEPNSGVLVAEVFEDTPAEQAGLRAYDIIRAVEGKRVHNANELRNRVAMIEPGSSAEFTILRDGETITRTIELTSRPDEQQAASKKESETTMKKTGLTLQNLNEQIRRRFDLKEDQKGVLVVEVNPTSPAARAGIRPGDIILEADRETVNSVSEFHEMVSESSKDAMLLRVQRGSRTFFTSIRIEQ